MTMTREDVIARFPPKPLKEKFQSTEEWEEALGRWNSTVGRAIARRLKSFNLPLYPDPAPKVDANLANADGVEQISTKHIPIKTMDMNSPDYHGHFRTKLEIFLQSEHERHKDKADPKPQK